MLLAFTRDEFALAFRRLGIPAEEADFAATAVARNPVPDFVSVDADVLAALSLVNADCERRVRAWIEALPADRRPTIVTRFALGRLHFGGRLPDVG
jgi:hypothetical protein